jgi:CDP-glucose 4,6-dehydratase
MQNGKSGSKFLKKKKVFWKNKKVIITGCTGFKGSWLSFILKRYGAKIYGIALKPQNKNDIFTKSNLLKEIKFYECDINDSNKLKTLFEKIKPDITFHLAAQSLVLESYQKKEETYKTNIIGSSNVIEACKNLKKKTTLLITTTDKVYKNYNNKKSFKENDTIGGNDPYSASKAALEILCDYYLDLSKKDKYFSLSVARSGNVIGGGDWSANRLFPDIINALRTNKEIIVRSPNSTRPWQHVLDPLYGYINLVEKNFQSKKYCKAYNFGPKNNSSEKVINILNLIKNKIPKLKITIKKNKFYESKTLGLNSNMSKKELSYRQVWNLKESVEKTLNWYYSFLKKNSVDDLCLKDIKNFEDNY